MDKTQFQKVTITLPSKLQENYRKVLESLGMTLSGRLALLIKRDFEKLNKVKNSL